MSSTVLVDLCDWLVSSLWELTQAAATTAGGCPPESAFSVIRQDLLEVLSCVGAEGSIPIDHTADPLLLPVHHNATPSNDIGLFLIRFRSFKCCLAAGDNEILIHRALAEACQLFLVDPGSIMWRFVSFLESLMIPSEVLSDQSFSGRSLLQVGGDVLQLILEFCHVNDLLEFQFVEKKYFYPSSQSEMWKFLMVERVWRSGPTGGFDHVMRIGRRRADEHLLSLPFSEKRVFKMLGFVQHLETFGCGNLLQKWQETGSLFHVKHLKLRSYDAKWLKSSPPWNSLKTIQFNILEDDFFDCSMLKHSKQTETVVLHFEERSCDPELPIDVDNILRKIKASVKRIELTALEVFVNWQTCDTSRMTIISLTRCQIDLISWMNASAGFTCLDSLTLSHVTFRNVNKNRTILEDILDFPWTTSLRKFTYEHVEESGKMDAVQMLKFSYQFRNLKCLKIAGFVQLEIISCVWMNSPALEHLNVPLVQPLEYAVLVFQSLPPSICEMCFSAFAVSQHEIGAFIEFVYQLGTAHPTLHKIKGEFPLDHSQILCVGSAVLRSTRRSAALRQQLKAIKLKESLIGAKRKR
eukprot:TRINITY_DN13033_c0_g1_i3.p1 TRINITY_DN13033_c0_g1~~TRINITY_DN13033_c0_g1_i3.p1  ORF type:complete len:580 (-),score=105.37 TRINITY_DN13033_c0_g1_i3:1871-3610(-)